MQKLGLKQYETYVEERLENQPVPITQVNERVIDVIPEECFSSGGTENAGLENAGP